MARRRARGRDISGVLLLDKPAGMTSNGALQKLKGLFDAKKAGHTGSLDPIATGLLPICLGEATKFSAYLLNADKGYQVVIKLGEKTNTADIGGEVIETRPIPELSSELINEVLSRFIGPIDQIPPMHSAIKQNGQRLYKLAHQGIEVERPPRCVTLHKIDLISFTDTELELSVLCSKGTYIRVLAEDIGEALGCGAHVQVLRRTQVGDYQLTDALTLSELSETKENNGLESLDEELLGVDSALVGWPGVNLTDDMAYFVRRGQAVLVPRAPTEGLVKLYASQQEFLGVGHVLDDGRVAPKRLVNS